MLASSSSGNVTYIATDSTRILVDAGLSRKETLVRLAAIGEPDPAIDAIVITHEHSDHVCGLPALVKKWKAPVYMTHLTAPTIDWCDAKPNVQPFQAGTSLIIGDIEVSSFTIPHDAIDPVGYTFRAQGIKLGVVTDLGYIPDSIKFHVRGCDLLLLESNHDIEMLKVGPYPWSVKQRVMGRKGHLSNEVVSDFIACDMDSTVSTLVLGHLSEHNNHPELVRLIANQALGRRGLFGGARLIVAEARKASEVFTY